MRLPAYPKCKPSGVEWLGDVPESWKVKQLKWAVMFQRGHDLPADEREEGSVPLVSSSGISATHSRAVAKAPGIVTGRYGTIGQFHLITRDYWPLNTTLYTIDLRGNEPRFLARMLAHLSPLFLLNAVKSAVPGIDRNDIHPIAAAVPPVAEQRTIADFLDREIQKIDTLVAKKRTLVERLKEKRTALISRTVTRGLPPDAARAAGLDPHPKLKPSGIDWLGDVPAHWSVRPFRGLIARLDQGWSPTADNSPAEKDQWGVLKLSAVREGRFVPEENKALEDVPINVVTITPQRNDLLISRANTPERVGDACVVDRDEPRLIIPDLIYRLKIESGTALPDYVCLYLLSKSGRAQIERDARGSSGSMVKLGQGHISAWILPVPPLAEQSTIVSYLEAETTKLSALVLQIESVIARLQEYRTALITAAVTGKIDVRQAPSSG